MMYRSVSQKIIIYGLCLYALMMPIMQNPYSPIFDHWAWSGRLQIADIILLAISPFGLFLLFKNYKYLHRTYRGLMFFLLFYLVSITLGVQSTQNLSSVFELASALLLSFLFLVVLASVQSMEHLNRILTMLFFGFTLVVISCLVGLVIYYVFDWQWGYVLQDNKVFPYLGEVARLTGPLQPTAKLLSSYFTLAVPLLVGYAFLVKKNKHRFVLIFLILVSVCLFPFTLSRGVVGFILSLGLVFFFTSKFFQTPKLIATTLFVFAGLAFLVTLISSTIFVTDKSMSYSFDSQPDKVHTVYYYYDPMKGGEKIKMEIEFGWDHYHWLKKGALEIFFKHPLGVGNGQYSQAIVQLEDEKTVPSGLSRHPTPQSEFLYAASERGLLGLTSVFLLFTSWLWFLRPGSGDIITAAAFGSLLSLCFLDTLHLEITRFRFLWFYAAIFIVFRQLKSLEQSH
jgi:hypothetical protein